MEALTASSLIVGIIAAIITTTIAILQFFKFKKKEKQAEKELQHIASTGVALGYYYNFVINVFSILKETQLELEVYKNNVHDSEENIKFDTNDVKLQIVMPENLKVESMDNALDKMRSHQKGDIVRKGNKRNMGINYRMDGNKLIILDFPTPLNAIREHMLLDKQFTTSLDKHGKLTSSSTLDSDNWKEAEKEELENFKTTILKLIERGRVGEGKGKIDFVSAKDVPLSQNA